MPKFPFLIKNRTLKREYCDEHVVDAHTMLYVRDYLMKLRQKMQPQDIKAPFRKAKVSFDRGHMTVRFVDRRQKDGLTHRYLVFQQAASQMQSFVLPSRMWTGLKSLAHVNPNSSPPGFETAAEVWDHFARVHQGNYVFRTASMKHNGEIYRAIRAVVSTRYRSYSNLQFVDDLIEYSGKFSRLPVLDWWLTDTGMRIRFLGIEPEIETFSMFDPDLVKEQDILPMVEVWNSEVGRASVGLRAGAYKLKTNTGIGHWDDKTSFRWTHRGAPDRIQKGVYRSFRALTTTAIEVVQAYNQASEVSIEDAEKWIRKELKQQQVSKRVIDLTVASLSTDKKTKGAMLSTIVDALTLAASKEDNIYTSSDIERAASRLLDRGLNRDDTETE